MKKVISFSLWGKKPKYCIGAIKNAQLAKTIYPGWVTRFYVGNDVQENIIDELKKADAEIVLCNDSGWNGMFWRFLAADSDDIVLSRDTDSRLNLREKYAVEDWLRSKNDFHIMRDHPWHTTVILGGMWGARNGILKGVTQLIANYKKNNQYQVDQNFLREVIYPRVYLNSLVHDEFFEIKPFPVKREEGLYVGAPYNENDQLEIKLLT